MEGFFGLNFHENLRKCSRVSICSRNFERPFTPRGWLRSASNFVKTRFGRSPTFHFSTAKTSKKINGFRVERWNVGDRLKRILTKFHADRSYRRGLTHRSKFAKIWHFRLRKIKCRGSSETRFGQVWRRSELCLRGKWPFKVSEMKRTNCTNSAHRPDPWLI